MKCIVNGVNMLPYLKAKGIKRDEYDLDAHNAGRTMNGVMHRAVIDQKLKLTLTFKPLTQEEAQIVLNAVKPQFFPVEFSDARRGDISLTMYANNVPAQVCNVAPDGSAKWEGIVIPLVER